MWHIVTDGVAWSVCPSVCVGLTNERTDEPIEMPSGADSDESKEPYINWCAHRHSLPGRLIDPCVVVMRLYMKLL